MGLKASGRGARTTTEASHLIVRWSLRFSANARFGEFGIEALTDTRWRRVPTFDVPLKGPGHGARVPLAARTDGLDRTPRGATERTHASFALRAFFGAWTGTARARRVGDHLDRLVPPPTDRAFSLSADLDRRFGGRASDARY